MEQPNCFGHHKGRRRRADERDRDRFAGKLETPAFIVINLQISVVLASHTVLMLSSPGIFVWRKIGPQLGRRPRIWECMEADGVEVVGCLTEAAFDDAKKLSSWRDLGVPGLSRNRTAPLPARPHGVGNWNRSNALPIWS